MTSSQESLDDFLKQEQLLLVSVYIIIVCVLHVCVRVHMWVRACVCIRVRVHVCACMRV